MRTRSNIRRKFTLFLALGAFLASPSQAKTSGASFLLINPTARTAALGNSGVSSIGDVGALFSNPAGLRHAAGKELMASQMQLYEDDSFSSFGYSHSLSRKNTLGIGAVYLKRADIQGRNELRQETGAIQSSDLAVQLSYGFSIFNKSSLGISLKALQQNIGGAKAQGTALDLGFQSPLSQRMNLGLTVSNLGPQMKFSSEQYSLPSMGTAGISYKAGIVLLMADLQTSLREGGSNARLGVEFQPMGNLTVRSGYVQGLKSEAGEIKNSEDSLSKFADFSAGLGLRLGLFQMDYAMVPHAALAATHMLTISGKFK